MRTTLFIIQKEFRQIFRNRTMLPIIFVLPIVQLLILANAATLDMKHIDFMVVDKDLSSVSRKLIDKFSNSPFFVLKKTCFSDKEAEEAMLENKTKLVINIPPDFEKHLYANGHADIQLQIDAINGMTAGLINAYSTGIINKFNRELLSDEGMNAFINMQPKNIDIQYRFWYNNELKFKFFMVPGILVLLVTLTSMFLASLNLVREKEMGTIEQINVTPIHKYQFIIGKLVPFWVIALFELAFGLTIGKLSFNIPLVGSLPLLFMFASVYLIAILGIGLLLSTLSQTQQQTMFLNFFFLITFILTSGIFTPAESMPHWAQKIDVINPLAYFMRVIRMILLKGSGFHDIFRDFAGISVFATIMVVLATWRYRKVA